MPEDRSAGAVPLALKNPRDELSPRIDSRFRIFTTEARSILSRTSGFIAEAGFTHSLSPSRNCTFACTYCYVPTMRLHAGLRPEDWRRWGQFTTFKTNAAQLALRQLRPDQRIYCSPLVDPYQPAELHQALMPALLSALIERPPAVFTIQTRGPGVLRDLPLLAELHRRTRLRISFSVTTDDDEVRRIYEPHCAPVAERLRTISELRQAGLEVYATLAPILPCDPERLAGLAIEATGRVLIGDPFHSRAGKSHGATTRDAAVAISDKHDWASWHEPSYQKGIVDRISAAAARAGQRFVVGPPGFRILSEVD